MQIKVGEEMVEVAYADIQEAVKAEPEYNAELNRVRIKGENEVRTTLTGEHQTALDMLADTHSTDLEAAKALATGTADDKFTVLMEANKTVAGTVEALKAELATEKENGIKAVLKAELANALAGVPDELVRNTLIESGMKTAVIGEDGQPYFNIGDGVMGGSKEMADQFSTKYPQHFKSNQPAGAGVTGAGLTGPNLLQAALGGDMASKIEYAKQHGMPAYLAEVEKAALQTTS